MLCSLLFFLIDFSLISHLSENPAQEVVVSREGHSHQHLSSGAGIQQAVVGRLEETLVWIEARLEEFVEELPEDAATVDARLIQTVSIQEMDSDPFLQVRF